MSDRQEYESLKLARFRKALDYEWSLFRLVRRAWRERKPKSQHRV